MILLLSGRPGSPFDFSDYLTYGLYVLILFAILYALVVANRKIYHSHWNTLIDNFNYSTKDFYNTLAKELKSHGIDNIKMKVVNKPEGHLLSSYRKYIEIKWKNVKYYVCAAPFGDGFFVSWWLFEKKSFGQKLIAGIPVIGNILERLFFPTTFYTIDTSSMFMTYAQGSVLKIIDEITKEQGIKAISELDRKPIMKDLFKR